MQGTTAEQATVSRNETWIRNPAGAFGIWDRWAASTGIPIHEAYFVPDLRTLELGWWEERQCHAAFLKLAGFEGVSEARVTEIPAGKTLPPLKLAFDEGVYVLEGRGLTNIWGETGSRSVSFEWQKHSLFLLPRHHYHQFSNVQGDRPIRLLHFNYLPISMMSIPDPAFFFNNSYLQDDRQTELAGLYSEAKAAEPRPGEPRGGGAGWVGNFFPDMGVWDKLGGGGARGAGARLVGLTFPGSPLTAHMAVLGSYTYKKAHRHGPGVVIVIPTGEGFTVLWSDGKDKIMVPWQEGSAFAPPDNWWHQHFNVGPAPARYLAIHALPALSTWSSREENLAQNQIEYTDEDPWIRDTFEAELAKRGLESRMPKEAYRDLNYKWTPIEV